MALTFEMIGQARPTNTSFATIATLAAGKSWLNGRFVVANTTGSAATFRICHDNDGTTFDETTALAWDVSVPGNTTVFLDLWLLSGTVNGSIAVRSGTASAMTFTLYAGVQT